MNRSILTIESKSSLPSDIKTINASIKKLSTKFPALFKHIPKKSKTPTLKRSLKDSLSFGLGPGHYKVRPASPSSSFQFSAVPRFNNFDIPRNILPNSNEKPLKRPKILSPETSKQRFFKALITQETKKRILSEKKSSLIKSLHFKHNRKEIETNKVLHGQVTKAWVCFASVVKSCEVLLRKMNYKRRLRIRNRKMTALFFWFSQAIGKFKKSLTRARIAIKTRLLKVLFIPMLRLKMFRIKRKYSRLVDFIIERRFDILELRTAMNAWTSCIVKIQFFARKYLTVYKNRKKSLLLYFVKVYKEMKQPKNQKLDSKSLVSVFPPKVLDVYLDKYIYQQKLAFLTKKNSKLRIFHKKIMKDFIVNVKNQKNFWNKIPPEAFNFDLIRNKKMNKKKQKTVRFRK